MPKPQLILFAILTLGSVALAQTTTSKLVLVGHPTISIPVQCNPQGNGSGRMKVRNEGQGPVSLYLTATEMLSRPPGKRVNPQVSVTQVPSTTQLAPSAPARNPSAAPPTPKGETQSDKKQLAPGEELWLQMDISGMYEDGEWETTLQNDNVDLGIVRVVTYETPFHITMDIPDPRAPELTFDKNKQAHFSLKNDDPIDYTIAWEYSINGSTVRSSDMPQKDRSCLQQSPTTTNDGKVPILANAFKQVSFSPACSWFGSRFTGLFKDQIGDGRLVISRLSPGCTSGGSITRSFKVKTRLMTSAGAARELWSDVWVFLMLLAGGVCSLVLNFALPNQMRRLKLKARLSELGRKVSDLPKDLASRLRVLVGLDQRLLKDRLRNLTWTNSDFTIEMQSIEGAVARLGTRIQLLDRLGTTRTDFGRLRSHMLAPTVISSMEATFDKIVRIGEKSDPTDSDVQTALTLITNLQSQLDNVGQADQGFAATLSRQAKAFQSDFDTNGITGKTPTCQDIRKALPGLFTQLETMKPDDLTPERYVDVDTVLFKLRLVRQFCWLLENLASSDPDRTALGSRLGVLLKHLKNDSWEEMSAAELLVQEMRENRFRTDVEDAITKQLARVKIDHVEVRQFDPCGFKLEFQSPTLDNAAALKEWICRWEFGRADEPKLAEEGREVTHYFQKADTYALEVTLIHTDDGTRLQVKDPTVTSIGVLPDSRRKFGRLVSALRQRDWQKAWAEWKLYRVGAGRVLETLRLLLALFIALIGLIAGAKDQLLKLDVVPALIAIFLVGFGADQVKTLLTQRQQK